MENEVTQPKISKLSLVLLILILILGGILGTLLLLGYPKDNTEPVNQVETGGQNGSYEEWPVPMPNQGSDANTEADQLEVDSENGGAAGEY